MMCYLCLLNCIVSQCNRLQYRYCCENLISVQASRLSQWCCWGFKSPEMWCIVFEWMVFDILKDHGAIVVIQGWNESTKILWNISNHLPSDTASYYTRPESSVMYLIMYVVFFLCTLCQHFNTTNYMIPALQVLVWDYSSLNICVWPT
jgi:hypothetical protein